MRNRLLFLTAALLLAGCGEQNPKNSANKTLPAPQATAPTLLAATPTPAPATTPPPAQKSATAPSTKSNDAAVSALLAKVEREYQAGEANYHAGHLAAAKDNFDRAVDLMLTSSISPKSDPRLNEEFEKVVEHVNQLEMAALQQGDGFTEQKSVPAPIAELNEMTFPVDPNIKAQAQAELAATTSDLPLVINDYVASFLSFFQTSRGRAVMERALTRAGRYRSMIQRILKEEGVPQDLMFLAQAESGFQPTALNPSGARGMWQLMSSRASEFGLQHTWWIDERQDPEKSTRAAAKHLRELYKQFGDWYLVMAAYNSGPGNVQYAVEKTGYADFWELYRRSVLPKETKNYVPIILAMTIVAKHPDQYGIQGVVPELPLETESVRVDYPVDLRLVAECAGVPVQKLIELNPSLLRLTTPPNSNFDLRLPIGTKDRYLAAINLIPADKRVSWRYHHVEPGDTLASIARQYHTTTQAILSANN
ncbi:MAG: transglycosylase SLT domain-containing protein, partial [Acidobacteriales bacterium]|nr:transglycosylase SLT domain-containing protein [Terriglobales bacterium]